jgi:hypothetical protein
MMRNSKLGCAQRGEGKGDRLVAKAGNCADFHVIILCNAISPIKLCLHY